MKAINLLYETGVSQHAELCNAFPIFIKKKPVLDCFEKMLNFFGVRLKSTNSKHARQ